MFYKNYYWGMNLIWWGLWIAFIVWIFALPYNIPGQRSKKEQPLDILKRRLANGEITVNEYQERKIALDHNLSI